MKYILKELVNKIPVPSDKKTKQKEYLESGTLPIIDQGKKIIGGFSNQMEKQLICDLPVIVFGDHTCNVKYINFPFGAGADGIKVFRPKNIVVSKYLYYGMQYLVFCLTDRGYGRHYQHLEKMSLNAPSISKQEQIVKQIEESLSQLDSAVETLNKTKQQLKIYRQAVLKQAFAKFNEFTTIRNATSLVTSGSRGWAKYYSTSGAAFIRIGNLNRYDISISLDDLQCVKLPDHAEGVRSRLEPSDVLISITADLGSIGLVPYNIGEGYINQHIALVRFQNKKQSRFLAWYLRSDIGQKELLKNKRGAGKLGLGLDDIRDSLIPVVDDTTAIEVVSKIEEKLVLCLNIEETVKQSLQQAEGLRQSVLKQAFNSSLTEINN